MSGPLEDRRYTQIDWKARRGKRAQVEAQKNNRGQTCRAALGTQWALNRGELPSSEPRAEP